MNIFITGGPGYVGTKLTAMLVQNSHRVTVIGHNPENKPVPPRILSPIGNDKSAEPRPGNVLPDTTRPPDSY